jgi:hypothetical protein
VKRYKKNVLGDFESSCCFVLDACTSEIMNSLPFYHSFNCVVAGPSQCGKTEFTFKLIRNAQSMIFPPPQRIVYCYGEWQDIFCDYPNVDFQEGVPDFSQFDGKKRTLVILDDLLSATDKNCEDLFTKGSHHRNLSIIYLTQNLFYKSKQNRTMSLNAHYLVLFKNPRDSTQIATLSRQIYPGKSKFLIESFQDATRKPYGYLVVDLKTDTEEAYRVRTCIFPEDEWHYVYVPK